MDAAANSDRDLHGDKIGRWADGIAPKRNAWIDRNRHYYKQDYEYLKYLIPEASRILVLGCGTGRLLSELRPSVGVGIDISTEMIAVAKADHPEYEFIAADLQDPATLSGLGDAFDYVVIPDTLGFLYDCEAFIDQLAQVCGDQTRIVITYFSHLWEPVLSLAEALSLRMPHPLLNWLSMDDIVNSLEMSDFERVHLERRLLVPFSFFGLGTLVNRYIAPLPLIRQFCLRHYIVARLPRPSAAPGSARAAPRARAARRSHPKRPESHRASVVRRPRSRPLTMLRTRRLPQCASAARRCSRSSSSAPPPRATTAASRRTPSSSPTAASAG